MKFDIKGSFWNVILTKDKKALRVNGKVCAGATHYREQTIYIDKGLKLSQTIRVLIHELTHVVIYLTQVSPKDIYTEEDVCEVMALYGGYIIGKAQEITRYLLEEKDA